MSDKKGRVPSASLSGPPSKPRKPKPTSSLARPRTPPPTPPQPLAGDGDAAVTVAVKKGDGSDEGPSVFEYLLAVFESPSWTQPLADFVDEYCVLFEADPGEGLKAAEEKESQFIHTRVHELFKGLVETLLCEHLDQVNVDLEAFVAACDAVSARREEEEAADEAGIGQQAMDHLLAMEDFATFKHLMVKRNLELELAEIETLLHEEEEEGSARGGEEDGEEEEDGGVVGIPEPRTPEEEDAQLEMALRASFDDSHGSGGSGGSSKGATASSLSGLLSSPSGVSSLSTPGSSLEGAIHVRRLSSLTASAASSSLSSITSSTATTSTTTSSSLSRAAQPPSSTSSSSSLSTSCWREAKAEEEGEGGAWAQQQLQSPGALAAAAKNKEEEGGEEGVEEVKDAGPNALV